MLALYSLVNTVMPRFQLLFVQTFLRILGPIQQHWLIVGVDADLSLK
jgi:hypothetical protein